MKLYKFRTETWTKSALSSEENPTNLPSGNWVKNGTIDFDPAGEERFGLSNKEIAEGIAEHGFVVWPAKDNSSGS